MVFVIKATLKDETRRVTFESSKFPPFSEVQHRLRASFNLPSTAHTFWVNVLFYPDDAQDARIMFKRHVCDAVEYETAQSPFLHGNFAAPALVFTILLSSDPRLDNIHGFHRANHLIQSAGDLAIHISGLEEGLAKSVSLLTALEAKLQSSEDSHDRMAVSFWGNRVEEKREHTRKLQDQLERCTKEFDHMNHELDGGMFFGSESLRRYAEDEGKEEQSRTHQTLDELAAWTAGNDDDVENLFPDLETLLRAPPPPVQPPMSWNSASTPRNDNHGFRTLIDRVSDVMQHPETARSLVPTQEIKTILDNFLKNLSEQLANTFDGAAAPHARDGPVSGAYQTSTQVQADSPELSQAQVQTDESAKPAGKLGKGGFRHKHISCDGCLTGIRGMRYKCEQCPDYDLCGSCLPLLSTSELHPVTHTFRAMLHHGLEQRIKLPSDAQASDVPVRHPASCDLCSQHILGVRWKCLNCPDWDCCASCAPTIAETHPNHSFVKIHATNDYVDRSDDPAKQAVHSGIVCDGCDKTIRGTRYKCMHPTCPDYDLCELCESAPFPVHPADHPMLKTKTPLRVEFESTLELPGRGIRSSIANPLAAGRHACHRGPRTFPRLSRAPWRQMHAREHVTYAPAVKPEEDDQPVFPGSYVQHVRSEIKPVANPFEDLLTPLIPDSASVKTEPSVYADARLAEEVTPIDDVRQKEAVEQEQVKEPVSPLDIFSWARHTTMPPGTILPPGAVFTKSWKVKHFASGADFDFDSVRLVHQTKPLLGPAVEKLIVVAKDDIKEGEEVLFHIEGLKVPDEPGREIVEEWRFEDADGNTYGQPLRVRITVEQDKSCPPSMNSSSVIMPSGVSTPALRTPQLAPMLPCQMPSLADLRRVAEEQRQIRDSPAPVDPAVFDPDLHVELNPAAVEDAEEEEYHMADDDDDASVISAGAHSLRSSVSSFFDIEDAPTITTPSVSASLNEDEFDFVDETDDETADEL